VPRCNTQSTKRSELRFRAVLGVGAREVRFERARDWANRDRACAGAWVEVSLDLPVYRSPGIHSKLQNTRGQIPGPFD